MVIYKVLKLFSLTKNVLNLWVKYRFENPGFTRPKVVNFNANDICNSGCVMCNIWEQKKTFEIEPVDLQRILQDDLFEELTHVGITGGEPTLRSDLSELFKAVITAKPDIKGLSMITNALKYEQVKTRVLESYEVCRRNQVHFSVMISLDGVGEIHDQIRGKAGNFESAIRLIKYLKNETNISVSVGCTISKGNVWRVDELLDYVKREKIYARFRIAEFINRLYNDSNTDVIRNFNEDESYHLQLFFMKLITTYERSEEVKRTYYSIIQMLQGGKRLTGCPYQQTGVVLNSKGEMAYCAPKSKIIGDAKVDSAGKIYEQNLDHRKKILKEDCANCIHDYHAPITYPEYIQQLKGKLFRRLINRFGIGRVVFLSQIPFPYKVQKNDKSIMIVGWYGTETVGDKAILKSIIDSYIDSDNSVKIFIASLYPFITRRTVKELGKEKNCSVIDAYSYDLIAYAKSCDEIVIGGGPLMELEELAILNISFAIAKKFGKKRVIFGCGIGPLKSEWSKGLVKEILELADSIKLRDTGSKLAALDFNSRLKIDVIGDPAKSTIKTFRTNDPKTQSKHISCYLREWTQEYSDESTDFTLIKKEFENGLASYIKVKAKELGVNKICFHHMHNFAVGNDDRDFSRKFVNQYFTNEEFEVEIDYKLSTIESIAESMMKSRLNICMRFHSVLFAHSLGTKYVAVDYTLGGKIKYYLEDNDPSAELVTINDLRHYENSSSTNFH